MDALTVILFRWLHLATAAVAVGGVFFIRVIFPVGLRAIDAEPARLVLLKCRRIFKMVVHTSILFLLVSGTYNAVRNWPQYTAAGPGVGHGLFGVHLLLGLAVFGILLWLLVSAEPRAENSKWMGIALLLMFLSIAAASTLKYVREHPRKKPMTDPAAMPLAAPATAPVSFDDHHGFSTCSNT